MPGLNTAAQPEPLITAIRVTDEEITASLSDGRTISVPLAWSWRLTEATPDQRNTFRLIGGGQGVHWPLLDEVQVIVLRRRAAVRCAGDERESQSRRGHRGPGSAPGQAAAQVHDEKIKRDGGRQLDGPSLFVRNQIADLKHNPVRVFVHKATEVMKREAVLRSKGGGLGV